MESKPEILLTAEDITQGIEYTRSIVIKSTNPNYDGRTITFRALSGEEFTKCMEKAGLSRDQNPTESFQFLIEAGKIGVTNPGVAAKFGKLDKDIIAEVGGAILGVSKMKEKETESFLSEQSR